MSAGNKHTKGPTKEQLEEIADVLYKMDIEKAIMMIELMLFVIKNKVGVE